MYTQNITNNNQLIDHMTKVKIFSYEKYFSISSPFCPELEGKLFDKPSFYTLCSRRQTCDFY